VGEKVLLKLQLYVQLSVVRCPYPKLSFQYFGPYTSLAKFSTVATGIQAGAPPDSLVHAVFHVSQLNSYAPDYTPVYSELPTPLQLDVAELLPEDILYRGLVKRANASYLQVLIKWTILPASMATWEDYTVLRQRFLAAAAWG
jgi:hypothetical protein